MKRIIEYNNLNKANIALSHGRLIMHKNKSFSDEGMEFKIESWDDIKSKDFDLLSSGTNTKNLFRKLGYDILESGELIDVKTGQKIKLSGNKEEFININDSPKLALISGSHHFVRNIAEFSELLAEKGELKFNANCN